MFNVVPLEKANAQSFEDFESSVLRVAEDHVQHFLYVDITISAHQNLLVFEFCKFF